MSTLGSIAGAVAGAGARHILIEPGRCAKVRHRRAKCDACMEACPEGAIVVKDNRIDLDPKLCAGCGACAAACPTQALQTIRPSFGELLASVDAAALDVSAPGGAEAAPDGGPADAAAPVTLEFACEHARPSSVSARIVVPFLSYVDEAVLLHAARRGFGSIVLTSCGDSGCLRFARAAVPAAIEAARALLGVAGSDCTLRMRREKPPVDASRPASGRARGSRIPAGSAGRPRPAVYGARDYSRRDALSDMASQARTIVAETAAAELRERLGGSQAGRDLLLAHAARDGILPTFPMPRAESLLDDLFEMNPGPAGPFEARGFSRVEVNAAACIRCAMCIRFCPTGALEGEQAPIGASPLGGWRPPGRAREDAGGGGSLAFRVSDCVGCRLCETACPLNCLKVCSEVDAATLFDLEPTDLLA